MARITQQKITPFLSFENQAEAAAKFYVSVFKRSKLLGLSRYGEAGPMPKGSVMTADFRIEGQRFTALNGGPSGFNQAVSFAVHCRTQNEVDYYWRRLTSGGGREIMCGWLQDKFGLSWQIVPDLLLELVTGKDKAKAARAMGAMMKMKKIDIAGIKRAALGR